jgi:hypothetical protein
MDRLRIPKEPYDQALFFMKEGDLTAAQGARLAGVSPEAFYSHCRRKGIDVSQSGKGRSISKETYLRAESLVMEQGYTVAEACKEVNIKTTSLYKYFQLNEVRVPKHKTNRSIEKAIAFQHQRIGLVEVGELFEEVPISRAVWRSKCLKCGQRFFLSHQKYSVWKNKNRLDELCCGDCARDMAERKRGQRKTFIQSLPTLEKRKSV